MFTAQSSAVAQISVSDLKRQSEQQSAFQCFTCLYNFYGQINQRVGIAPADLALLPDGWRFAAAVSELRGHSSLCKHVQTNLDLERQRLRNLTVKRLRTAVQHVITATEKEARLIDEGETKSDAGQMDKKSSENFRG